MTYKIRVRGNPNWNAQPRCILAISVGQPYHEGAKLSAVVEWINNHYQECIIDLSDSLQRYNDSTFAKNPQTAHEHANRQGDEWLARNVDILGLFKVPYVIIRWDQWLNDPEYLFVHHQIKNLYITNDVFCNAVNIDIENFIKRRNDLSDNNKRIITENSKSFIIEECSAQTLLARKFPGAKIYPSHQLNALKVLREELILNAPKGLANENYVRINLERKVAV